MPAVLELQNVQGFPSLFQGIQTYTFSGAIPTQFLSTDTLSGVAWAGADMSPIFSPTVTWSGGTGWATGLIDLAIPTGVTTLLDTTGDYRLQAYATRGGITFPIVDCLLTILPAPGSATQSILTYNSYRDMLGYAPWVANLQGDDAYQEGCYDQRIKARNWMDWAILNNYRGMGVGNFGEASVLAFAFGGGAGQRRSLGPSPSMIGYLEANGLILRPQIVEACAYKSIEWVALGQVGTNNQLASLGVYYREMATRTLIATTAEINVNDVGVGSIFVNLGSSNTLHT